MFLNVSQLSRVAVKNSYLATTLASLTKTAPNIIKNIYLIPVSNSKFHTNILLKQSDQNSTSKKPTTSSILGSQSPATGQSILTDDLVKKFANVTEKEAAESQQSKNRNESGPKDQEENKGRFAKMFSREHGWKISLAFIVLMSGGMVFYFLTTFGPPKLDESNQPVNFNAAVVF
jgi:hypothetical protein